MRKICLLLAILAVWLSAAVMPARADDGSAIRAVIEDQIAAFQRDDLDAAFAHAAPGIQAKFGDPARFGQMVRQGYPMVWRPARVEMLGLETTPRGPTQSVLFEDGAGTLWQADYYMEEIDGRWRIAGVQIRRLPGVSS
jgi:hypothetical protein